MRRRNAASKPGGAGGGGVEAVAEGARRLRGCRRHARQRCIADGPVSGRPEIASLDHEVLLPLDRKLVPKRLRNQPVRIATSFPGCFGRWSRQRKFAITRPAAARTYYPAFARPAQIGTNREGLFRLSPGSRPVNRRAPIGLRQKIILNNEICQLFHVFAICSDKPAANVRTREISRGRPFLQ